MRFEKMSRTQELGIFISLNIYWVPVSKALKRQGSPILGEFTLCTDFTSAHSGLQTPILHHTTWLGGLSSSPPKYLSGFPSRSNDMAVTVIKERGKCGGVDRQNCASMKGSLSTNKKSLWNSSQAPRFSVQSRSLWYNIFWPNNSICCKSAKLELKSSARPQS